ncbi:hypothetical protein MKEN_00752200 [Mycena kentingensis (nom. inval.)]|nr:hypothetical protein MKEN_00752200 [Mycena kentingensis (nom. inval.)]
MDAQYPPPGYQFPEISTDIEEYIPTFHPNYCSNPLPAPVPQQPINFTFISRHPIPEDAATAPPHPHRRNDRPNLRLDPRASTTLGSGIAASSVDAHTHTPRPETLPASPPCPVCRAIVPPGMKWGRNPCAAFVEMLAWICAVGELSRKRIGDGDDGGAHSVAPVSLLG